LPVPAPRSFAWEGARGLQSVTYEGLALADAAGDDAEIESNGTTEDAGDEAANGEGFLRFFAAGAETGAGEAVETGESASGD